jgi:hypothetical protein
MINQAAETLYRCSELCVNKEMVAVAGGNRYTKQNKTTPVYRKLKQMAAHFNVTNKQHDVYN